MTTKKPKKKSVLMWITKDLNGYYGPYLWEKRFQSEKELGGGRKWVRVKLVEVKR